MKGLATFAIVVGLVCVVLAGVYYWTPAGSLPTFLPGFQSGSTEIHIKHALAALVVGVLLFVLGWMGTRSRA